MEDNIIVTVSCSNMRGSPGRTSPFGQMGDGRLGQTLLLMALSSLPILIFQLFLLRV